MILRILLILSESCSLLAKYQLDVQELTVPSRYDLGDSVSMNGDIMVSGACFDNFYGYNTGMAKVHCHCSYLISFP